MRYFLLNSMMIAFCVVWFTACSSEKVQESVNDIATDSSLLAKPADDGKKAAFEFAETEFFFGTINQGDIVNHVFKFKNIGEAPLVISNISAACGCTTPEYTKEPVAPGAEGEIKVQFNSAGKQGQQVKSITITANTPETTHQLTLKGEIKVVDPSMGPRKERLN